MRTLPRQCPRPSPALNPTHLGTRAQSRDPVSLTTPNAFWGYIHSSSCSELVCFKDEDACFKNYNSLFLPLEAIFLLTMFSVLGTNLEMHSVHCQGEWKKKIWKIFCFISLLMILTNKAPPPSEDGGRIGNSHPFRSKNKYLLMIWII